MKTSLFCLCFILYTSLVSHAQFTLGVGGGANLSNASFDGFEVFDPEMTAQFYFHVVPKYSVSSKISVLTSIAYAQKGYKISPFGSQNTYKYRYTYLDFIPEIEYRIHQNIGIGLGMNVSFTLDEEQNSGDNDWFSTRELETISSNDLSLSVSVRGYFKNVYLIVSYQHGIKDIANQVFTNDNGEPIDGKQFNRVLQIGVGYLFELNPQ